MTENSDIQLAERLQRRRMRMMTAQSVLFVIWQASFFSSLADLEGPRRSVENVKISAFFVWAALLLLLLATGGAWWRGRGIRHLVNDEVSREHFRSAHVWGYWAAMLSCLSIYVLQLFTPIGTIVSLHLLLSIGIAVPMIRFVWLERRADG